ncbi:MAG: diaminopimelate epimerase [Nitrospirae bacterium]|nr:MAG: diaminopimelate epimerase [Nitrospirota bacterium]
MTVNFTKMHGLGNDFVLIDSINQNWLNNTDEKWLSRVATFLCNRRFGIGADQLLLLLPSDRADFRMRIFNADGSEVEMCGNGIRCFARYIWDRGLSQKSPLEVETLAGIIKPERRNSHVRVDMGEPEFRPERIPLYVDQLDKDRLTPDGRVINYPLEVEDQQFHLSCLSMGNPHCVIVVNDVKSFPVSYFGPILENHQLFPNRTNVEFIEVISRDEIKMRVWERGAGETMACGTGASASAVVTALRGLTNREVTVHLLGGDLFIQWAEDNHVYMTGPATAVFEGSINIPDEV